MAGMVTFCADLQHVLDSKRRLCHSDGMLPSIKAFEGGGIRIHWVAEGQNTVAGTAGRMKFARHQAEGVGRA